MQKNKYNMYTTSIIKKTCKNFVKFLNLSIPSTILMYSSNVYSIDLLNIYHQAIQNDKTLENAKYTYESAKTEIPMARSVFFPSLSLNASTASIKDKTSTGNAQDISLVATENLNWSSFYLYSQAKYAVLQAEITYELAKQTLNSTIVNEYFQVLFDIDNLNYAKQFLEYNKKLLNFTKAQYKVGLVAKTDIETALQGYATAQAQLVQYENKLYNDIDLVTISTNKTYKYQEFAQLNPNFKLSKPYPENFNTWVKIAKKNNLTVLFDLSQEDYQKQQVSVDKSGYIPNASLIYTHDRVSSKGKAFAKDFRRLDTIQANLNWNIGAFARLSDATGNNTYYSTKKDELILKSYQEQLLEDIRNASYQARSSYLNIISDISQIKAYRQAVISAKSALDAANAQYMAGTNTLINVLQQQQAWSQSYVSLSQSIQQYFNDRIALKQSVGQLSEKDIKEINNLLIPNWKPSMAKYNKNNEETNKKDKQQTSNINNNNKNKKNNQTMQIKPPLKKDKITTQNKTNTASGGISFHTHHHYYN